MITVLTYSRYINSCPLKRQRFRKQRFQLRKADDMVSNAFHLASQAPPGCSLAFWKPPPLILVRRVVCSRIIWAIFCSLQFLDVACSSHRRNLSIGFAARLTLQPSDARQFVHAEVKSLGYIISRDGIKIGEDPSQAIANLPQPTTIKELRSVIGALNFVDKSLPDSLKSPSLVWLLRLTTSLNTVFYEE